MKFFYIIISTFSLTVIFCIVMGVVQMKDRPELRQPVTFYARSTVAFSRGMEGQSIVLKDSAGDLHNIPISGGYYDKLADSIDKHCQIGDIIK